MKLLAYYIYYVHVTKFAAFLLKSCYMTSHIIIHQQKKNGCS